MAFLLSCCWFYLLDVCRDVATSVALLLRLTATIVFLSVFMPTSASAEKIVDIYSFQQLVLDESAAIRNQTLSTGLATVFVRLAGNDSVLNTPAVIDALGRAPSYLSQYSYQTTDATLTIAGAQRPARLLSLQFSPVAVKSLFTSAQLPIWPENRPEVLLWLAGERGGRVLLEAEAPEMLAMKAAADNRGLPISAPLLDLTDRQRLSAARLWAMDVSSIQAASQRYDLEATLAGRFNNTGLGRQPWQARFVLLYQGERTILRANATTSEQLAQNIIDQTTEYLSEMNAIVVSDDDASAPSMTITVNNVVEFADYSRLLAYLDKLPIVANVVVIRAQGSNLTLSIAYNGSQEQLLNTLSTADVLREVSRYSSVVPSVAPIAPATPLIATTSPPNIAVDAITGQVITAVYEWR